MIERLLLPPLLVVGWVGFIVMLLVHVELYITGPIMEEE